MTGKKRVLIVCPAPVACQAQKRSKVSRYFRHTRLSLLTVAAATPPDWDVSIVDEYVSPIDFSEEFDCVGISFMTAGAPRAYEIADLCRSRGITVVAGGFHPTFLPNEALEHFDSVCVGDAEPSWPVMLKDIEANRLKPLYTSDRNRSLSNLPIPRRDLLTKASYLTRNTVQTSRGCPNRCHFCSVSAFHNATYRHRPVSDVIAEIRNLSGKLLIFIDDNIVSDRSYALELFGALKELDRHWFSQAELKIAKDPELLDAAVESGCQGLFVGFESLSDENLKAMHKGFNRAEEYLRSTETLHSRGIAVEAAFIFGLDNDTVDVFDKTLDFLTESAVEVAQLTMMTPFPGTALYEQLEREGRILTRDWKYYDFNHVVFRPMRMSPEELQEGTDKLV
ncbi:MAG: B12-binding domain-containing radical SAM protein, partial [Spirochaetaceae bacterium]|nr:B12-binding domain-containing radical SAM protein [Spirochaetaceae bacterium]